MDISTEDVIDLTGSASMLIAPMTDDASFLDLSLSSRMNKFGATTPLQVQATVSLEEDDVLTLSIPSTSRDRSPNPHSSPGASTPSTIAYSEKDDNVEYLIDSDEEDSGVGTSDRRVEVATLVEDGGTSGDVSRPGGRNRGVLNCLQDNDGDEAPSSEIKCVDTSDEEYEDTFLEPGLLSRLATQPDVYSSDNISCRPSTSMPTEQLTNVRNKPVKPSPIKRSRYPCQNPTTGVIQDNKESEINSKRRLAKRSPEEIETAKLEAQEKRQARQAASEATKVAKATEKKMMNRDKLLKQAELQKQRSIRPNECLRHMTIILDADLPGCSGLYDYLMVASGEKSDVSDKEITIALSKKLPVRNLIAWSRKVHENCIGVDGNMFRKEYTVPEKQVLVYLTLPEFLEMVQNQKERTRCEMTSLTLVTKLREVLTQLKCQDARICFVVCGVELYKRHLKTLRNRAHKKVVLGMDDSKESDHGNKQKRPPVAPKALRDIHIIVEPGDICRALVDLEVQCGSSVVMVESEDELGEVIWRMTKSVGESLHKAQKDEKSSWIGFVSKSDVGELLDGAPGASLDIGPDGQGGRRVWSAQLQQISTISKIVAQSIVAHYGSPRILMAGYDACQDVEQCEKLLSEIVIRRGAGITSSTSRLGPALSRKIYWALASEDPDFMLNSKN